MNKIKRTIKTVCRTVAWMVGVQAAFGVYAADIAGDKTWALTIPEGGAQNNTKVTLSDDNWVLNAWVVNEQAKTLGIDISTSVSDADGGNGAGLALTKDGSGNWIGSGELDLRGTITVNGAASDWKITNSGIFQKNRQLPCAPKLVLVNFAASNKKGSWICLSLS